MNGICDTCKRSNNCRKPIGGVDSCKRYVRAKESNYERLFGTPERAARTIEKACFLCDGRVACDDCVLGEMRGFNNTEDALLEWLRGDA